MKLHINFDHFKYSLRVNKQRILGEYSSFSKPSTWKYLQLDWITFKLVSKRSVTPKTGPPFYVVIRATQRCSRFRGQCLHFPTIDPTEYWSGPGKQQKQTHDLPLYSKALNRLCFPAHVLLCTHGVSIPCQITWQKNLSIVFFNGDIRNHSSRSGNANFDWFKGLLP